VMQSQVSTSNSILQCLKL